MATPDFGSAAWNQVNKAVTKGTKEVVDKGRTVAAAAAVNAIPTGRVASEVGKFVSRTTEGKMVAGEAKQVVRKFTQGKGANVVEQAPKSLGEGAKSPIPGTKITVVKDTRAQTPLQQATVTVGRTARETTAKAGTYAKGAATGAIVTNEVKKGTQDNHAVTSVDRKTGKAK